MPVLSNRTKSGKMFTPNYGALKGIDWTFASAVTRGATHGIHPYPAKFIPQIPRALIRELHPGDGSAILDPFCGSGTCLVEAAVAGIQSVGVDLNPLACLMSKVKVTKVDAGRISGAARNAIRNAESSKRPVAPSDIPRIDHWFKDDIQRALTVLLRALDEETDTDIRDALRIALSSVIVRVSNQESDTRYAAIDKATAGIDVFRLFNQAAISIDNAISETWGGLLEPASVRIIHKSILRVEPAEIGPVSLVVTSPPYPNAYEYWLYHKYRMYWLGMDPIAVREEEIGARPHYFKANPQTAADFAQQMRKVFGLLSDVVVPGGHVCIQIGNSIIHGEPVNNDEILTLAAESNGFDKVMTLERDIPVTRTAFNPQHGRIRNEVILVFRRAGQ